MTNEEKAKMIAEQCKPCSADFYSGIEQGVLLALNAEKTTFEKAKKWDELDAEIAEFYPSDGEVSDDEDGGLLSIGEICATKLGYM